MLKHAPKSLFQTVIACALFLIASTVSAATLELARQFKEGYQLLVAGDAGKAYAVLQTHDHWLVPLQDFHLYFLGKSALQSARYGEAIKAYRRLVNDYGNSPWQLAARRELAKSLWRSGDVTDAEIIINALLQTPNKTEKRWIQEDQALMWSETGRSAQAAPLWRQLYETARWDSEATRLQKLLQQLRVAGKPDPLEYSAAQRQTLAQQFLKRDLPGVAATVLAPLVQLHEGSVRGDTAVIDLLATAQFKARNYREAAWLLAELLKRNGENDVGTLTLLGSAYARSSQYDAAIRTQKKIMALETDDRRALYKLAFLEADRHHDRDAIVYAKQYLNQYPKGAERDKINWLQAWSYYRLKEYSQAILQFRNYKDVATHKEDQKRADFWIAHCLEHMGNRVGASTMWGMLATQGGYYGYLSSAHMRNATVQWRLPLRQPDKAMRYNAQSAQVALQSLGLYSLLPMVMPNGDYRALIQLAARSVGLTPELVLAIIHTESNFRPDVVSPAGAIGLMQLIPPTATQLAQDLQLDAFHEENLIKPIWNVTLGMAYLTQLGTLFDHQLVPMIASYNAGERAVARWVAESTLKDPETFVEEIPYDETRAYVKRVLSYMW